MKLSDLEKVVKIHKGLLRILTRLLPTQPCSPKIFSFERNTAQGKTSKHFKIPCTIKHFKTGFQIKIVQTLFYVIE